MNLSQTKRLPNAYYKRSNSNKKNIATLSPYIRTKHKAPTMTRYQQLCQAIPQNPHTWLITGVAGFIGSNLLADISNAATLLGYQPTHRIGQGVAIGWYERQSCVMLALTGAVSA